MKDIRIDTLRIHQESADFSRHYKKFYIINGDRSRTYNSLFLTKNQKYGDANDNIYYNTLEEAIEVATIFVKNKYHQPKNKYRVTLELSFDREYDLPSEWNWRYMLQFNDPKDNVQVIACEKIS